MTPTQKQMPDYWRAFSSFMLWLLYSEIWRIQGLGINWGTQLSHPLPPLKMVQLLKDNHIPKIKLFDSDSVVLRALAGSNIEVMVAIPNKLLQSLTDAGAAQDWIKDNISRYLFQGGVNIKYVAVGNEPFLATYNGSFMSLTLPALQNIQRALNKANLGDQIKATVPLNADVLSDSTYPSQGSFRSDIADIMSQITAFLYQNRCPFTINIYPFISLYRDKHFPTEYAFFDGNASPVIDGSNVYKNVFDASYDTLVAALTKLGYSNMQIIVGEIGWPTDGDANANVQYAQRFNQGFLNHVLSNVGTPLRPNMAINFYLFSLIDEDQKSIAPGNFERHWGLFRYDGRAKYPLSLSGGNGNSLVNAQGIQYLPRQWCVLNPNADTSNLGESVTYACSNSDCTSLGFGSSCNPYLDVKGNASYAFNQYYQMNNQDPGTCYFGGLGQVTTQNPSVSNCEFMIEVANFSGQTPSHRRRFGLTTILVILVLLLL